MRRLVILSVLATLMPACNLYFGGDGKPDAGICNESPPAVAELRDPQSGECQGFSSGGGCYGYPGIDIAWPDWAACYGPCDGLDEATCEATPACRAILVDTCPVCDALVPIQPEVFAGCWGTAPSGPIEGGGCAGLDAQTCSEHDDCRAVHTGTGTIGSDGTWTGTIQTFEYCENEVTPPPACATLDENGCIGRADCTPLYQGHDCTCDASGCTCATWTFDRCSDGDAGGFACGDQMCAAGQVCEVGYGGPVDNPPWYTCADTPAACEGVGANDICACLENAGVCTNGCDLDAAGNVTTSCYYP